MPCKVRDISAGIAPGHWPSILLGEHDPIRFLQHPLTTPKDPRLGITTSDDDGCW